MFNDRVEKSTDLRSALRAGGINQRTNQAVRFACQILSLAALVSFSGCLAGGDLLEEPIHGYRNHVWANRAYNLRYNKCDREYSDHFKQGFIDGYCDVCDGGDGYVPALPPQDYRSYQYQSPEGAKCVNTWFKAYPLGVKAAREDGSGSFQKVYISKMIQSAVVQDNAKHVLPDDVPVVTSAEPNTGANAAPVERGSANDANVLDRRATYIPFIPTFRR